MPLRRCLSVTLMIGLCAPLALPSLALAQDEGHRRGRKYKAPPETARIEVQVVKGFNGKPIVNAAVVFHPEKDGKDEGNLEVKTDPDGKAVIDVIPIGSTVRVQVIANGFATYADDFLIAEANKEIHVKMLRPQAQISAYTDNEGKASERKPGVQEPPQIKVTGKPGNAPPAAGTTTTPPSSTSPASSDGVPPTSPAPPAKPNL